MDFNQEYIKIILTILYIILYYTYFLTLCVYHLGINIIYRLLSTSG